MLPGPVALRYALVLISIPAHERTESGIESPFWKLVSTTVLVDAFQSAKPTTAELAVVGGGGGGGVVVPPLMPAREISLDFVLSSVPLQAVTVTKIVSASGTTRS